MKILLIIGLLAGALLAQFRTIKCPVDDTTAWMTGKTQVIGSHLMYEYRCSQSHLFWVRADQRGVRP